MRSYIKIVALVLAFVPVAYALNDVPTDNPYYQAVNYLVEEEVVEGYSDGTFRPENNINRAEFLKIVMEAAFDELNGQNCFEDVDQQWFAVYICSAKDRGVVDGYDDGYFRL